SYEKSEKPVPESNYPPEIANILVKKCATSGCHNSLSRANVGGLDFTTWDLMFEGGRNGSSVVPFSPQYSYLLYSVNTDSSLGQTLEPLMPYELPPLSREEYQLLYDWILRGAPDKNGMLKFPDDPNRKKAYICMQGCDQVAVIDADSKIIMKYIGVGTDPLTIESPHMVRVSPDRQFWYVVFYSGQVLQKFRTSDDSLVASLMLGSGDWNTIIITPDSKKGFVSATNLQRTAVVDLESMTIETNISPEFPHGGFITPDGNWLYLTSQSGNFINKVDLNDPFYSYNSIVLVPGQSKTTSSSLDPHEMILSADGTKYYISCQKSNEVRVFQTSNDSFLTAIPVGEQPQEFAISTSKPYVFVTCTNDQLDAVRRGSVYIINSNTNTVVNYVYSGYQPHGIAVDEDHACVYIANLNLDQSGPAPHHSSDCGGRNGYLTVIDLNTLQLLRKELSDGNSFQYKNELLNFPYFVDYKK
ncbi:MAG TPA: hypothetical protein PKJ62_04750, partial [Bacteroidia bacterium]|nr:hypothetical protein [Bacteroidia bacterium]